MSEIFLILLAHAFMHWLLLTARMKQGSAPILSLLVVFITLSGKKPLHLNEKMRMEVLLEQLFLNFLKSFEQCDKNNSNQPSEIYLIIY